MEQYLYPEIVLHVFLNHIFMTKIKICGITTLENALDTCRAGVDALGFNFSSTSPRKISPLQAKAIIEKLPPFIHAVGIFVEQTTDEINAICRHCHLQGAQLHNDRYSPEDARAITETTVIKVFRPKENFSVEEAIDFARKSGINNFLFDTYCKEMAGGTGESICTQLASRIFRQLGNSYYAILAGGLNETNVSQAILSTRPYGVDTASGVECKPGFKDPEKVKAFIRAVHNTTI